MKILITGKPNWYEKDAHSAISFYRIARPLFELARQYPHIEVIESQEGTWPEIVKADIVFCHSPVHAQAINAIFIAKQERKKVWLDFDDLIFKDEIPTSNLAWTVFNSGESQRNLTAAIKSADVISVSTDQIKTTLIEKYGYPAEQIWVIPNAIPDGLWESRAKFDPDRGGAQKRLVWRGSVTHEGNLLLYRNGIKPHPNVGYLFIGTMPWMLQTKYGGHLEELSYQPWERPLHRYFKLLKDIKPDYFFVCLESCDFNKAKSNIAWLEATYAGAACIAPEFMPEFAKVPTVKYSTPKGLLNIISIIGKGKDLLTENYMRSRAEIESKYLLSITNKLRLSLLNSLFPEERHLGGIEQAAAAVRRLGEEWKGFSGVVPRMKERYPGISNLWAAGEYAEHKGEEE